MKIHYPKTRITKIIKLIAVVSFMVTISCSTDDSETLSTSSESEEIINEVTEGENETNGTTIPLYKSIEFESNFVLDESRLMLNYILSETEYSDFLEGSGDLKLITKKAFEYLNDDFDFVVILSVEDEHPSDLYYGNSTIIQNQIEGLGQTIYNNASNYGSAERLKSIIHMPKTEYVRNGPFLHEIAHIWANNNFIETTVSGHWGVASTGGQLGGFDTLEELGNNTFRGSLNGTDGFGGFANGGNLIPYGNLELYVMGLISADEVEDVKVAVNPAGGTGAGEFTAEEIKTYTIEDLISKHGERTPNSLYSQKEFKGLTVVISTEAIADTKVEELRLNLENFSRQEEPDSYWAGNYNFWTATKGKASIDFSITEENIK